MNRMLFHPSQKVLENTKRNVENATIQNTVDRAGEMFNREEWLLLFQRACED